MKKGSESVEWTIITVSHNSAATLHSAWSGWERQQGIDWVVVDNASVDDSRDVAERLGARVISLPRNIGFGRANNIGLAESSSRYVLFANPDLTVAQADLPALRQAIDSLGGLVAPQLIGSDGSFQPNGRGYPTLRNKVLNRIHDSGHGSYRKYADPGQAIPVCFVIGAAVCGTRSEFERISGWDERFFLYYEDSDICIREWLIGGRVTLVGSVQWRHSWARATKTFRINPWRREIASMVRFYSKYPYLLGSDALAARHLPNIELNLKVGYEG